jgi:Exonuclease
MTEVSKGGLAFVDCETTGLDADRHEIWEVGLILSGEKETSHRWFLPVDLSRADSVALNIGKFHQRHPDGYDFDNIGQLTDLQSFARDFAGMTRGRHLVGAVISFDEERLRRLLRANGACPEWHYHLIDVEALAVGYIKGIDQHYAIPLPFNSRELSLALGVDPTQFELHTGLGDARWAKAIYETVMGRTSPRRFEYPVGDNR